MGVYKILKEGILRQNLGFSEETASVSVDNMLIETEKIISQLESIDTEEVNKLLPYVDVFYNSITSDELTDLQKNEVFSKIKQISRVVCLEADNPNTLDQLTLPQDPSSVPLDSPEIMQNAEKEEGESEEEGDTTSQPETTFKDEFPEVENISELERQYLDWLEIIKSKSLYKVISSYSDDYKTGDIDLLDRKFLWGLTKAVSSTITHLAIGAEQKPENVLLFEVYYDELIKCLNGIIHAKEQRDILVSYEFMYKFLSLDKEDKEE